MTVLALDDSPIPLYLLYKISANCGDRLCGEVQLVALSCATDFASSLFCSW